LLGNRPNSIADKESNMTSRSRPLIVATLAVALFSLPACSQDPGSEAVTAQSAAPAEAATPVKIAPHEMTCAEVGDTFGDVEYEEEASYLAAWAYGVRTGAQGMDFEKNPVTMAGLEDFVTRVILNCKADPDKLFVDAILE